MPGILTWTFVMQAIDTLALNLQNKWVFPHCLAFAKDAIQSGDSNVRAAACTVLVVVAEGCCDACTSHLSDVLQVCPFMFFAHYCVVGLPLVTLAERCVKFRLSTPSLLVVHALVSNALQKLVLLSEL